MLDSRKSGLIVRPSVLASDRNLVGFDKPICLGGTYNPPRPPRFGPFVLDELLQSGKQIQNMLLAKYDTLGRELTEMSKDSDVLRPWLELKRAQNAGRLPDALSTEVNRLEAHVLEIREGWGTIWSTSPSKNQYANKDQQKKAKKNDQAKIDELARRYAQTPEGCEMLALLGNVEKLKASCLYDMRPKVAFKFAFQAVCKIKAEAQGSKAFTREFADAMSISGAEVRVRTQASTVREDA